MTLKVIGAGLGRTGTVSLKLALEHLGFGPCYHALEIAASIRTALPLWLAAIDGKPDWAAIFDGYASTTDYPGCCYWRELLALNPDAKVILTTRDADGWFESVSATLFAPERLRRLAGTPMERLNSLFTRDFGDRIGDRDVLTDYFDRWNQAVIDEVPRDRLLVFSSKDGWAPLCAFLDVPIPSAPYPRVNSREELTERIETDHEQPPTPAEVELRMRAYLDQMRRSAFAGSG
jgi:hypothetical protein